MSVRFTTGALRVADRTHVVLPRIGRVRTHEATTALLERVRSKTARILSGTVSREADRWYVNFTCEVERKQRKPSHPASVIGVDAGVRHLAVLSSGEIVPNPRPAGVCLEADRAAQPPTGPPREGEPELGRHSGAARPGPCAGRADPS